MRTTVEIADDKLVKLKKLAAERGERGFSKILDEALAAFLAGKAEESPEERRRAIEALYGAWDQTTEDALRTRIAESRRQWR